MEVQMSRKIREVAADDELKSQCLDLIDEISETGDEIVVMKAGRPVARIVPLGGVPSLRGSVLYQGDLISPIDDGEPID